MLMLPLETLPGWPEAPEPSLLLMLMLTIIGPLAVGVVVTAIFFGPQLARQARSSDSREVARSNES